MGGVRIEREGGFEMGALDTGHQVLFQARVDCDALDKPRLAFVLADEVGAEASADLLGEFIRIFCYWSIVGECLQDER